jgi:hypothetical protein
MGVIYAPRTSAEQFNQEDRYRRTPVAIAYIASSTKLMALQWF